ncbi:MAG: relaxase domain-containing protein [Bifidobacteriaceae bacterium]|jgi:conjugative relaxase-like TrwC/TraI family protein|nr:relaxase domain-containing protein [Bifidobacteriaceae bacterium]
MTLKPMHAGDGYRYLTRTVAAGDGDRDLATPLTRYYAEKGNPPGRWFGSGLNRLGDAAERIATGQQVTEQELELLLGYGHDPVTGAKLGRAYQRRSGVSESPAGTRAASTAAGTRRAVAGFDHTFTVPKSVSVLWGLADAGTQQIIANCHLQAIAHTMNLIEQQIAATRIGATRPSSGSASAGAVVQAEVTGLIAAAFDHYDSRLGDPLLHSHVVVSNKVQTASDGKWRSLDGRGFHQAAVAMSELYNAVLADLITRDLGLAWETRDRGRGRNPSWELAVVPPALIAMFSARSRAIESEADRLISEFTEHHGRAPGRETIIRLRQQATLATRPDKQVHSLAELTTAWRDRASGLLGQDAAAWAVNVAAGSGVQALLRADDVPLDLVGQLGQAVVQTVSDRRATWRRWNLYAEAVRSTMGWRFATALDREIISEAITRAAQDHSLRLTPDQRAPTPEVFTRADGTSQFRPRHHAVFTSEAVFAAEQRVLDLAERTDGSTVSAGAVQRIIAREDALGPVLSMDQAEAVVAISTSGRVVDLLVGPAGAGKTTALAALRQAWEAEHGTSSVTGLAPSATAAAVLAEDLGIASENTAKWLAEFDAGRTKFCRDELVLIDEASMCGTLSLDRITALAASAGAKVVLVGDWAQLQAVEAGGLFTLLAGARDDAPELFDLHRFRHSWEKQASLDLRHGDPAVLAAYQRHGRLHGGDADTMADAAYQAWQSDQAGGLASVLIAEDGTTVRALNSRARLDRIESGQVDPAKSVRLAEDNQASVGDLVITRRNDRRLIAGKTGWVRNGDRWTVTKVHSDGAITVRRAHRRYGASVVLPAAYAAESLDLGYAVTAYRAQGVTVDTAHLVVTEATSRESLYVAMTRGREANHAYVVTGATDARSEADRIGHAGPADNAATVLSKVIQTSGAEPSAHQAGREEAEHWESTAQWAAEYETITQAVLQEHCDTVLTAVGLTGEQVAQIRERPGYSHLVTSITDLARQGIDAKTVLPRLFRPDPEQPDLVAALRAAVIRASAQSAGRPVRRSQQGLVAGMLPVPPVPMSVDMAQALETRAKLITDRAIQLVERAQREHSPWLEAIGRAPAGSREAAAWHRTVLAVAAYRDRYGVTDPKPLGHHPTNQAQQRDRNRVNRLIAALHPEQPGGQPFAYQTPPPVRSQRPSLSM